MNDIPNHARSVIAEARLVAEGDVEGLDGLLGALRRYDEVERPAPFEGYARLVAVDGQYGAAVYTNLKTFGGDHTDLWCCTITPTERVR